MLAIQESLARGSLAEVAKWAVTFPAPSSPIFFSPCPGSFVPYRLGRSLQGGHASSYLAGLEVSKYDILFGSQFCWKDSQPSDRHCTSAGANFVTECANFVTAPLFSATIIWKILRSQEQTRVASKLHPPERFVEI